MIDYTFFLCLTLRGVDDDDDDDDVDIDVLDDVDDDDTTLWFWRVCSLFPRYLYDNAVYNNYFACTGVTSGCDDDACELYVDVDYEWTTEDEELA